MWAYIKKRFVKAPKESKMGQEIGFAGGYFKIKSSDLKKRNRSVWVEDTFINYSEADLVSTKQNYLGIALAPYRIWLFWITLLLGLLILMSRAIQLQVVNGAYYRSVAENNRIRIYNLPAPRGIIYDINGTPLVRNIPSFSLYITPNIFFSSEDNPDRVYIWLKQNLNIDPDNESLQQALAVNKKQKEYSEPRLIAENIDYELALKMQIESFDYQGVNIEIQSKREYLNTKNNKLIYSLGHILGYEGKVSASEYEEQKKYGYLFNDNIGKTGLELSLEKILRGVYGKEQVEVDSSGQAIKIIAQEKVEKGDSVVLNIDLVMQERLESIISSYLSKSGKKRASAIVMDPNNGAIKTLISLPGYDNNLFSGGISQNDYQALINDPNKPLFNRSISGEYPSGSTIKPVMAASALEEGIITAATSFMSVGGIRIGQWFFPDWQAGGHGLTDVKKAIAQSVNTFFYIIGGGYGQQPGLGVYKIKEYLERFGLNKITGVELPNEKTGFLPTPEWKETTKGEPWYIGDTYHLAIGQGDLLVTPIQVANYVNVFANGGILYKPQLINHYIDQNNGEKVEIKTEILHENFIKENNIELVRQGMQQAVRSGSARILNSLPVSSGAKTGTAQWQLDKPAHAWFVAFAPYSEPELSIMVLVEEGEEGSKITAQIVSEFLSWYFREYKRH